MVNITHPIMSDIVINCLLCYISTALKFNHEKDIIQVCMGFYDLNSIKIAKEELYKYLQERPNRNRGSDGKLNDINDIISAYKDCNERKVKLPTYVADMPTGLPPIYGYSVLQDKLDSLNNENMKLREEIKNINHQTIDETVFLEDTFIIKKDLQQLKDLFTSVNYKLRRNSLPLNLPQLHSLSPSAPPLTQITDSLSESSKVSNQFCNCKNYNKILNEINEIKDLIKGKLKFETSCDEENFDLNNSILKLEKDIDSLLDKPLDSTRPKSNLVENEEIDYWKPSAPSLSQINIDNSKDMFGSQDTQSTLYSSIVKSSPKVQNKINESQSKRNPISRQNQSRSSIIRSNAGYIEVVNSRKKQNNQYGTRKTTNNKFKSAQKTADLYIGRCDSETTSEEISTHLKDELNTPCLKCEELKTRIPFSKAFKVTVYLNDRDQLLDTSCWPEGVVARKFFTKNN